MSKNKKCKETWFKKGPNGLVLIRLNDDLKNIN